MRPRLKVSLLRSNPSSALHELDDHPTQVANLFYGLFLNYKMKILTVPCVSGLFVEKESEVTVPGMSNA